MNLLDSLLDAIIRLQGEALVMHVGEKPYVITTSSSLYAFRGPVAWGQVELSTRALTAEAVHGMLGHLLPPESRQGLEEFGATEYEVPGDRGGERFTVIVARNGDDVWLEVRRRHPEPEAVVPEETAAVPEAVTAGALPGATIEAESPAAAVEQRSVDADDEIEPVESGRAEPDEGFEISLEAEAEERIEIVHEIAQELPADEDVDALLAATNAELHQQTEAIAAEPVVPEPVASEPVVSESVVSAPVVSEQRSAVILPLVRTGVRQEPPPPAVVVTPVERMLRVAAARGASTVYVVAGSKPMIRVDGEISALDAEPVFAAADVDRVVMEMAPARGRDGSQPAEWMSDLPDVGRVRCLTFVDQRGPVVIFRMIPPRAISAEQLGLAGEVRSLAAQPDGLVLVTGPRASGKSTLLSAFVDLINRTRSDHVITIESQIAFVHESRRSFVSQREVRGDGEAVATALRSALREDPDVLVVEDLRTAEIVSIALEAAESGRLVLGSCSAASTVAAIERLVELFPADRRTQAQGAIAASLRGAVSQLLLRKANGGRIAAREVLLNTPAVTGLIADGKLSQLPVALESGRKHGMVPMNESLASLVRDGSVLAAEAYRKALDRDGLLALLKRDGMDISFAERLA